MVLEHLNGQHVYKHLEHNLDRHTLSRINKLDNTYRNELIKKRVILPHSI